MDTPSCLAIPESVSPDLILYPPELAGGAAGAEGKAVAERLRVFETEVVMDSHGPGPNDPVNEAIFGHLACVVSHKLHPCSGRHVVKSSSSAVPSVVTGRGFGVRPRTRITVQMFCLCQQPVPDVISRPRDEAGSRRQPSVDAVTPPAAGGCHVFVTANRREPFGQPVVGFRSSWTLAG